MRNKYTEELITSSYREQKRKRHNDNYLPIRVKKSNNESINRTQFPIDQEFVELNINNGMRGNKKSHVWQSTA